MNRIAYESLSIQRRRPRRAKRKRSRLGRSGTLPCCLIGIAIGALACSDEPSSDVGSPLVSKVGSAPPQLGKRSVQRADRAREAFDRWAPLLTSGAIEEARALCGGWLGEPDRGHHGEAHKCLANVEIARSRTPAQGLPKGGLGLRAPVSRAGVDAAVEHYVAAIAATPLDPDAHVGRVDILVVSGRYREANIALDESLQTFSSRGLLDNWFKLLARFQRAGAVDEGLAFLEVIEKHHPLDHRVVSNLGAYHAMAGNSDEALAYSERAVAINPDDPINKWNLARIYDRRGQLDDADRNYREALAVFGNADPRARCDYVEFLATRLLDTTRACEFARSRCVELYQKNCTDDTDDTDVDGQADEADSAKG
ncbi:MAG: tetratricopeptide repeat protein [Deltaproteobacteria bacterium]|nr:tetratricopeptide repeat protein [Deltaproteobacteria bacterium]